MQTPAQRLQTAWQTAANFKDFVFHLGYQGFEPPRCLRKIFARTELHRTWFGGFTGLAILSIDELR
jgi:hypothetical protein